MLSTSHQNHGRIFKSARGVIAAMFFLNRSKNGEFDLIAADFYSEIAAKIKFANS